MQFKPVLAVAGLLAFLAAANPNPQSSEQTTAAVHALESYAEMVATQTDFLSILSSISTDMAALASVTAFEASVSRQLRAGQTVASNYLDGFPSGIRPFFASIVSQEYAILASNGFTSLANQLPAMATSTSTGAAPRETGGLKVAGAVAAGFVGAMMAL